MANRYYVYVLKSLIKDVHYIGSTKDLVSRIARHNQGGSNWTKRYKPWELVYGEEFENKTEALKREKQIKSYNGGDALKKLINK